MSLRVTRDGVKALGKVKCDEKRTFPLQIQAF